MKKTKQINVKMTIDEFLKLQHLAIEASKKIGVIVTPTNYVRNLIQAQNSKAINCYVEKEI